MELFSRWFGRRERQASEASEEPPKAETTVPERLPQPIAKQRSGGNGESEEGSRMREKVQYLLDTAINPAVADHGGMVSLLDVKDNVVYLQMGGGCQGCGMADVTLKQGIERMIREELPEVVDILDVTDHSGGQNPYYTASKK